MHPSRLRNVFCWTLVALMSDEAGGGGPYHHCHWFQRDDSISIRW